VPADDPDERSVFVKNVHFKTNVSDLKEHFKECGNIVRITIPVDKASGQAKG
jgi:polyadenylate-binding protein 2